MAKDNDISLEGHVPVVAIAGLNTNKASYLGSTVEVVGAATFDSTSSFAATATFAVTSNLFADPN